MTGMKSSGCGRLQNTGKMLNGFGNTIILVVANFDDRDAEVAVNIPQHLFEFYGLNESSEVHAEELLASCPFHIPFNSKEPTPLLVQAHSGRLLRFNL